MDRQNSQFCHGIVGTSDAAVIDVLIEHGTYRLIGFSKNEIFGVQWRKLPVKFDITIIISLTGTIDDSFFFTPGECGKTWQSNVGNRPFGDGKPTIKMVILGMVFHKFSIVCLPQ